MTMMSTTMLSSLHVRTMPSLTKQIRSFHPVDHQSELNEEIDLSPSARYFDVRISFRTVSHSIRIYARSLLHSSATQTRHLRIAHRHGKTRSRIHAAVDAFLHRIFQGKSLSLICGSLRWLFDEIQSWRDEYEELLKPADNKKESR